MQTIAFVGKIYNMKMVKGKTPRLNFRIAVRKKYVSDEDKKDGKVNVFVPVVAFGKTAELIEQYFEDGSVIGLNNCEYSTFEYEDDEGETAYGHNFKVGGIDFLPSGEDNGNGGSSKKSSGSKRRARDEEEDEEEEERPRRKKKPASGSSGASKAPKKKPVYEDEEEEEEEGAYPF